MAIRPSVWIDDPHPIFRRGLAATLSDAYRVVGESAELRPMPRGRPADVLIFNLTNASLQKLGPLAETTALIALISLRNAQLHARALAAGVSGLMLRERISCHQLRMAIEAALGGQTCVPTVLVADIMESAAESIVDPDRIGLLSRELEVLRRLADGDDTKGIAVDMNYSERTVKNVVHDLLIKMNCRNRAHAVAIAARQGII